MPENLTTGTELEGDGLLVARTKVAAARSRGEQPVGRRLHRPNRHQRLTAASR